jgi:multidrug resistance efflux pump
MKHTSIAFTALRLFAALSVCSAAFPVSSNAGDGGQQKTPLISKGYTDAPAGISLIAGDSEGGNTVFKLLIREGQQVTRGEIIAVLSNYPKATVALRVAEGDLAKLRFIDAEALRKIRPAQIALQEAALQSAEQNNRLRALERARSNKPLDQRELEARIADLDLQKQRSDLQLAKQALASDCERNRIDISKIEALVEHERKVQEQSLIRSPLNGVVIQIYSRVGEQFNSKGIAKIVDMTQLRVIAEVDELYIGRVTVGGKVEVAFRGNPKTYHGTIIYVASSVKRMQRADPSASSSTEARTIEVQIGFDDTSDIPQVLGREARVVFL